MKRIRAALKNKSNWPSLVTLLLILACSVFSFWDTKFAEQALSAAFALVAVEFFIILVLHLEEVKGAIGDLSQGKGARLARWKSGITRRVYVDVKKELFFCGGTLSRLISEREELKASNKSRIRMLAMNIDDEAVLEQYTAAFGRPPSLDSIKHLEPFAAMKNVQIRTVDFPLTLHVSAKDIHTATGIIQICIRGYTKSGYSSPCMELSPADTEWYEYYKEQIELLWAQGTPWPQQTKEGQP